jgi:hypothetical protein
MKRRFTSASDSDSLELLLDTLCNVFGGIVLIACLLAILPRQHMPSPLIPVESASAAMLERRMISARGEVARIQSEIERLSRSVDPQLAELQARRDSLRRNHDRLQTNIKSREDKESSEAEARAIIGQGDTEALAEMLKELKLRKSKSENIESAATDKIRFLKERIEKLHDEAGALPNGRVQAVRFPRERNGESSPFPIIVRHNAIYPLVLGRDFEPNPAVKRTPNQSNDGFRADPIMGRGIVGQDPDKAFAAALKVAAAKGLYATLYLYPESHHAFGDLREILAKSKVPYGLEFMDPGMNLNFGSEGTAPPEL